MAKTYERIKFRVFHMPCCGVIICWVNSRFPSFCPECGHRIYTMVRTEQHTQLFDDEAVLEYNTDKVIEIVPVFGGSNTH